MSELTRLRCQVLAIIETGIIHAAVNRGLGRHSSSLSSSGLDQYAKVSTW